MNAEEKVQLIRKGNELFNKGEIEEAKKYFIKAEYNDGIRRIADHYFYNKNAILKALPLYIKCKSQAHVEEIYNRMAQTLRRWISQDKEKPSKGEEVKHGNATKQSIAPSEVAKPKENKTPATNSINIPINKPKSIAEQIIEKLKKEKQERQAQNKKKNLS